MARESTFTYNSKNAVRDYNYYKRPKSISPFNSRKNCGRCDIEIPKGSPLLQDGTFGPVCRDCKDVLTAKPEE